MSHIWPIITTTTHPSGSNAWLAEYTRAAHGGSNLQLHLHSYDLQEFLTSTEMNGSVPSEVQLRNVFHYDADLSF